MKYCNACGMPLNNKEDFAKEDTNSNFCRYCTDLDGNVKPVEEIFEGGVQFFMSQFGNDRKRAERITRKNMINQPYWKDKDYAILKGETATDEEFAEVMKKM
ncbi:AraC family transcriptional regulator [Candidatus Roizmanbacteria bacterium]|jgi:hypothetical protein|nr:AraC family transcriptional regulator [Candidatus Roizmanbacteria bacterium]